MSDEEEQRSPFLLITHHSSLCLYSRRFILLAVVRIFARDNGAGARVLCEQQERVAQYRALKLAHTRASQTVSDLESLRVERARRTHLRRDLRTNRYQDRRDAS